MSFVWKVGLGVPVTLETMSEDLDNPRFRLVRNTDGVFCDVSFDPVGSYSRPDVL